MLKRTAAEAIDALGNQRNVAITMDDGIISEVVHETSAADSVVLPAFVNAHDHARPMRPSSVGGFAMPLEIWLNRLALFLPGRSVSGGGRSPRARGARRPMRSHDSSHAANGIH